MKYFALGVVMLLGLGVCSSVWSAGFTNEEESLNEYRSGRMPSVLSGDGQWLVYLDGDSVLHRKNISADAEQKIILFRTPQLIGASFNGEKVVARKDSCISIIDFSKSNPSIRHLNSGCENIVTSPQHEPGDGFYGSLGVAISSDDKLIAFDEVIPSNQRIIVLMDSTTGEIITRIPVVGETLHIQFVDNNSKLFVVQGIFGEQWEAAARPSSLQFAVWDLKTRKLHAFFESALTSITLNTLMWSFSEATGNLLGIGQVPGTDSGGNELIPVWSFNVKQCRAASLFSLKVNDQLNDFTVDPLGRWVATVEGQKIVIRKSSNGDVLSERELENKTRSFVSSPDGKTLFGIESGVPDEARLINRSQAYSGGGKIVTVALTPKIEDLPVQEITSWSAEACKIEDEVVGARQLSVVDAPVKLYEMDLGESDLEKAMPELANCYSPVNYTNGAIFNKWGLSGDGHLWIDSYDHLDEFELLTRKSISRVPLARSPDQCNISVFSQRSLLSWQGDKVILQPFDKSTPEKVIAQKAGHLAANITQKDNWVGVAWASTNEESAVKAPVIYDVGAGQEIAVLPDVYIEVDEPSFDYLPPVNQLKAGTYQWEASYMGSVRAHFRSPENQKVSTVLWDGLSYPQAFDARLNDVPLEDRKIVDLGLGMAALRQQSGVTLYNASTKKRYTEIQLQNVRGLAWSGKDRVLLIETMAVQDENGKSKWTLHAYKVD